MLEIPRRLGPYEIIAPLGAGGMGEIYRARDTRLDREVAIKVLLERFADDAHQRERFEREVRAVAALSHPNIVAIHDVGTHDGITYAVMELLDGETLRTRLTKGAIPWSEAVEVGAAIADGLAAAHAKGIIHRDIKPENLVLTTDGQVKILDFGLVRFNPLPSSQSETGPYVPALTDAGTVLGTIGYMSPEQVRCQPTDARSDLFSLGCVLYEMVAGSRPFQRATPAETMTAILHDQTPDPVNSGHPVPTELTRLIRQCLAKNLHQRLQSARDLALGLRAIASESGPAQPPAGSRRSRPIVFILTALLLIGVSAAVYFLVSGRHPHPGKSAQEGKAIEVVAVLPFENLGGDAKTEYLSDGLADHLITSLGQVRPHELKVRSFTSVSRYKRQRSDVLTMGRELKVQVIVTGTLQQQGDILSIGVELVDAQEDNRIWGKRYQGKLSGILDLHDQIARDVAANMRLRLTGDEEHRLTKRGTQIPEAYRLYLYGRYFWNKRTEEGLKKAGEYFQEAIIKDDSYALAHVGLADSYMHRATYGFVPPKEGMALAKASALKALAIDDKNPEAHATLGFISERYDWNWPEAERFKRAVELDPNYPTAHLWYSYFLGDRKRFAESLAESRRAQELDPLALVASSTVAWTYYFARDYDQAIEHLKKTLDIDPNFWLAHDYLGRAYYQKGMFEQAIVAFQKADAMAPNTPIVIAELGCAYAASGEKAKAQAALDELTKLAKQRYVPAFVFAVAHSGLGEKDQAFAWLEKAYEERSSVFAYLETEPMFDGLRSDARITHMLKKVGTPVPSQVKER